MPLKKLHSELKILQQESPKTEPRMDFIIRYTMYQTYPSTKILSQMQYTLEKYDQRIATHFELWIKYLKSLYLPLPVSIQSFS